MTELNYKPLSEYLLRKIKNYIFKIEVQGKLGSCFFFETSNKRSSKVTKYLCINYDLISHEFIESNGEIVINKEIIIKLDKNTIMIPFKRQCIFIIIKDINIPDCYILNLDIKEIKGKEEEKFEDDKYINMDEYLFTYYKSNNEYKIGYFVGKILDLDGYKIRHQFNPKNILTVSPICIVKNNQFKLIGIQLDNQDVKDYKFMSYGFLLKYLLIETNIINLEVDEDNNHLPNNSFYNISMLDEFSKNYFSFYTLEQYNKSIKYLHIKLTEYYREQTEQNFNTMYIRVDKPEFSKYLKNLILFKNIRKNLYQIFHDNEIINNLNDILHSNNYDLIERFSYFISGFIYVIKSFSDESKNHFREDGYELYTNMQLSYEDLAALDLIANARSNKDKIITFKGFLNDVMSSEIMSGKIAKFISNIIDIKNYFTFKKTDKYVTKVYIEHNFDTHWEASCFSKTSNNKIFNLFTFFKVNELNINFQEKRAELKLELVGKNEVFEEKFSENDSKYINYDINYEEYNINYKDKSIVKITLP